jgi:hypothetical protein
MSLAIEVRDTTATTILLPPCNQILIGGAISQNLLCQTSFPLAVPQVSTQRDEGFEN